MKTGAQANVTPLVGLHVLVVDDDPDARTLMTMLLTYRGALVTVADSARAALDHLGRVTPSVVICDIAMPEHDGYWLMRELRAHAPERRPVPVIAVTAYDQTHGPDRTLVAGFDAHLRKPIDPWELCRTILTLARHGGTSATGTSPHA